MICPNCGASNGNGSIYCKKCGANMNNQNAPMTRGWAMESNGGQKVFRKNAGSVLFIVTAILFCLATVFDIAGAIAQNGKTSGMLSYFAYMMDFNQVEAFLDTVHSMKVGSIIFIILSKWPAYLYATALWMMFAAAVSKKRLVSSSGLTIVKVVLTIQFVLSIISYTLLEIAMIIMIVVSATSREMEGTVIIWVLALIVGIISEVIQVLFYHFAIKNTKSVQESLVSNSVPDGLNLFVPIMNILQAIGTMLSVILSSVVMNWMMGMVSRYTWGFMDLGSYGKTSPLVIISAIITSVTLILFAVVQFRYSAALRKEKYSGQSSAVNTYGYAQNNMNTQNRGQQFGQTQFRPSNNNQFYSQNSYNNRDTSVLNQSSENETSVLGYDQGATTNMMGYSAGSESDTTVLGAQTSTNVQMQSVVTCKKCNNQYYDSEAFCPYCGAAK